jgi:DNA-binding CsgD family transcriptional regulator
MRRPSLSPPLRPDDPSARNLLGHENGHAGHSIVGRLTAGDGTDVVFAAGWRKTPFLTAEIAWLTRAIPVVWSTAENLLHLQSVPSGIRVFLEQLVSPAFVVDEGLHLHETNHRGRKLLMDGKLMRTDHGRLVGANAAITDGLKDVLRSVTLSRFDRRWTDTAVPLSADGRGFAFAWVGELPIPHDAGQMLVLVPRVDAAAGARRIAMAFGLNPAEEKIVARILYGHCPRRTGAELGLTEATVRTYTKRIMLKLGINRQTELFLLYILTLSPFRAGL